MTHDHPRRGWRATVVAAFVFVAMQATPIVHAQSSGLTFDGDVAIFTQVVKADKTAEFEQLMRRVQQALAASDNPQRKQQAQGWKVVRVAQPLPDGVAYFHLIQPVVRGADYSMLPILYDAFPAERQAFYDLYRDTLVKNLSLATGTLAVDLSAAGAPAAADPSSAPAAPATTTTGSPDSAVNTTGHGATTAAR
jgi:hypothetical protein